MTLWAGVYTIFMIVLFGVMTFMFGAIVAGLFSLKRTLDSLKRNYSIVTTLQSNTPRKLHLRGSGLALYCCKDYILGLENNFILSLTKRLFYGILYIEKEDWEEWREWRKWREQSEIEDKKKDYKDYKEWREQDEIEDKKDHKGLLL